MQLLLARLASSVSSDIPAPRCELNDALQTGLSPIVGNILGLQSLGLWLLSIMVVAAIVMVLFERARKGILGKILWVVAILAFGGLLLNAFSLFTPSPC